MPAKDSVRAIQWKDGALHLLDQRLLPAREAYLRLESAEAVAAAIRDMVVRGAPAIGVTAAYGMALAARSAAGASDPLTVLKRAGEILNAARPTAVNLAWAVGRQRDLAESLLPSADLFETLLEAAHGMLEADIAANRRIGDFGAALLPEGGGVLTHCNTGSLATGGFGTALGVIRAAAAVGKGVHVYADETRPWLQGARLTAWELQRDGIAFDLIVEGAAASLMAAGSVHAVIVGADRIAANGDTANKIGTYGLAVLARHHRIPFYVAAPCSTIDAATPTGREIIIEERDPAEVLRCAGQPVAPLGVSARNPAFDVTPADLIDAIVTEAGIIRPVNRGTVAACLRG